MSIFYKKSIKIVFITVCLVSLLGFNLITSASNTNPSEASSKHEIKVTLLGTGTPNLAFKRHGASNLVEIGDEKFLFDAGYGTALKLVEHGVQPGKINKIFLTHLHSDHIVGLDDTLLLGWLASGGDRRAPVHVWGPKGTNALMVNLKDMYREDINQRIKYAQELNSASSNPNGVEFTAHEIKEGIVYDEKGIQIIAFNVTHDMEPAFGYRINYKGHSVVISGDTTYNENLIKHAKGADVIIHEVSVARPEDLEKNEWVRLVMSKHTSVEEAAKVFSMTKPKLAVYTHIAFLGGLKEEDAHVIERTNEIFKGKALMGEDLMTITIGKKIEVEYPE